jgi:plastocyanin
MVVRGPLVVLALASLVGSASALAAPAHTSAATVTVSMTEFKFALSKKTVARGAVTFKVTNKGTTAHNFKIAGKRTPVIGAGRSATLKVVFAKPGKYPYLCTLPSHALAGMKGVLTVR